MSDITRGYIESYLAAIRPQEKPWVTELELYAKTHDVPIIKHDARAFLMNLIRIHKPKHILEVGTAIGYSALSMLSVMDNGHVTTIEKSTEMIEVASANFEKHGVSNQITLLSGDSDDILPNLKERFDMIFMDGAKGQYLAYLEKCIDLLPLGGILVSDNVLQGGYIAKSKWSIPRRQRTIHSRMRDYLWALNHHNQLSTSILPVSDGLTISIKIKESK